MGDVGVVGVVEEARAELIEPAVALAATDGAGSAATDAASWALAAPLCATVAVPGFAAELAATVAVDARDTRCAAGAGVAGSAESAVVTG